MKLLLVLLVAGLVAHGQETPGAKATPPTPAAAPDDVSELSKALSEAGNSPNDFIRVLEAHLAKYPSTSRRTEIERALAKAAIETKDDARIIRYGELVLARDLSDVQLLDRVTRAYLAKEDKASAARALELAKKSGQSIADLRKQPAPGRLSAGQWTDEGEKAAARALSLQARAEGLLGNTSAAVEAAKTGFGVYPTAEGAREWSRWLRAQGDQAAAVDHLADAFTLDDPRSTDADRAKDRRAMGALYTKWKGSEKGLGDVVLASYDRTAALMEDRAARLKTLDPNAQAGTILDFTLPGANGQDLPLRTLKGKTLVLDFWATWCGPCKVQRPLYNQVEKKFKEKPEVVFLSVNTDEQRALVAPFLKNLQWTNPVYFDGGLAEYVKVTSIPTTLIVNREGQVASRMNGFIPERFVDLLTERIQDTLR